MPNLKINNIFGYFCELKTISENTDIFLFVYPMVQWFSYRCVHKIKRNLKLFLILTNIILSVLQQNKWSTKVIWTMCNKYTCMYTNIMAYKVLLLNQTNVIVFLNDVYMMWNCIQYFMHLNGVFEDWEIFNSDKCALHFGIIYIYIYIYIYI